MSYTKREKSIRILFSQPTNSTGEKKTLFLKLNSKYV